MNEVLIPVWYAKPGSDEKRYGFYCWNCKTKGPQALSEELAAEAWNRRVK
jgi:hypothetical protein